MEEDGTMIVLLVLVTLILMMDGPWSVNESLLLIKYDVNIVKVNDNDM